MKEKVAEKGRGSEMGETERERAMDNVEGRNRVEIVKKGENRKEETRIPDTG